MEESNIIKCKYLLFIIILCIFSPGCKEKKVKLPVLKEEPPLIETESETINKSINKEKTQKNITPTISKDSGKLQEIPNTNGFEEYRLRPGDIIEISVWGEKMTKEVIVGPDGTISYILIGEIKAAGKTIKELRKEIERRLSEYIRSPKVSIIGKKLEGNYVTIIGAVISGGKKLVYAGDRILDILARAEGLKYNVYGEPVADLSKAYISRNGKILDVDFAKLIQEGDMKYNILVRAGDFIYIPSSTAAPICVIGEVNNPTTVRSRTELTLLDAIATAGGFKNSAYTRSICVIRGSLKSPKVIRVSFPKIVAGKQKNIRLKSGDIVYVPPTLITHIERISRQILPFLEILLKSDDVRLRVINTK